MKNNSILSIFISLALAFQGCSTGTSKEAVNEPKENSVETFLLRKDKITTQFQLPGELIANQQVDIYAKVTSFVKAIHVDIGTEVSEGQLLLTLEAPEVNSQLAAAESRLKSIEAIYTADNANYNRLLETSKTAGAISQNDLDQATAKKNSSLSNLDAAKAAYKEIGVIQNYLEIRAPFSGIITSRNVNLGAYVGPSGKGSEFPLVTLQDQKKLRLTIAVPEAYTAYLKNGDEVHFKVKSLPQEEFKATVKRMAGALDLKLRAEKIEMDVDNSSRKLLAGMVAEVGLTFAAPDSSFTIPKTALLNSNEGIFVIRVVNHKTEKVEVKKGRELNDKVEIYGPVNLNDILITKANEEIKNGTDVILQESKMK